MSAVESVGADGHGPAAILQVRDVTMRFGGIVALDGLSFDIAEGHICGLIGPFVLLRQMAFAVHGAAELSFTGAAAGLLVLASVLGVVLLPGYARRLRARRRAIYRESRAERGKAPR